MIFITLGSQKFQFNRLLQEIDKLIEEKVIQEEVFAQIGYSDYTPQKYKYKEFLDRSEFSDIMNRSEKVITHGGTGAIIGAINKGKKVIAVPRKSKYSEHVDNHQADIVSTFGKKELIIDVQDVSELKYAITMLNKFKPKKYESNTKVVLKDLEEYIDSIFT